MTEMIIFLCVGVFIPLSFALIVRRLVCLSRRIDRLEEYTDCLTRGVDDDV